MLRSAKPVQWITRAEAAEILRVSPQTIKNYEKHGLLKSKRLTDRVNDRGTPTGISLYSRAAVEALPKESTS